MAGSRNWTFLTPHASALVLLSTDPDMTIREIAVRMECTERSVSGLLRDLSEGGYITRIQVGRRRRTLRVDIHLNRPLRMVGYAHLRIGPLVQFLGHYPQSEEPLLAPLPSASIA